MTFTKKSDGKQSYAELVAAEEAVAPPPAAPVPPSAAPEAPDPAAVIAALTARLAALEAALAHQPAVATAPLPPAPEVHGLPVPPPPGIHPDIGQWHGLPATPAAPDVPGYWFRDPRTGYAHKVVSTNEDTIKRCMAEGFLLVPDPTVTPGVPIFGEPTKKLADQLGLGASAGVQRMN